MVPCSVKAFVLLSIENCWDAIQDEIQEDGEDKESGGMGKQGVYPRGKYTNHGTNSRYGGWSPQGINRFNELYELVEDNCNKPWAEKVEEEVKKKLLVWHHRTTNPQMNKRRVGRYY